MSIREKALNAKDVPSEIIDVPEWDTKIEVRGLTAGEAIDFYDKVSNRNAAGEITINRKWWGPGLVIACSYDPESGEKAFDPADRDMLATKASAVITRIAGAAARLSGLGAEDREVAEDFDVAH